MAEFSADTAICYYCWVNRGWTPSQFNALSRREKLLVAEFVKKEVKAREELSRKK